MILISDAGFAVELPNTPSEAGGPNAVNLDTVCVQQHCVLLHTSNMHNRNHLVRTPEGKIRKIPWTAGNPSLDEKYCKADQNDP